MNNNTLMTVILCILVFGIGFVLGRVTYDNPVVGSVSTTVQESMGTQNETPQTTTQTQSEDAATVDVNALTEGQRKLIEALGIDANSITITPEMIACAEAKLGSARITEIQNGATPSFSEGVSLAACYTSGS